MKDAHTIFREGIFECLAQRRKVIQQALSLNGVRSSLAFLVVLGGGGKKLYHILSDLSSG